VRRAIEVTLDDLGVYMPQSAWSQEFEHFEGYLADRLDIEADQISGWELAGTTSDAVIVEVTYSACGGKP
jgi:hypothetical protein